MRLLAALPGLLLLLLPSQATAQQGTIRYDQARAYEFEIPERIGEELRSQIATQRITPMVMHFSGSEWVIIPEAGAPEPAPVSDRPGIMARMTMGSMARSDHEEYLQTYVSAERGTITETRDFMDRVFRLSGPQPSFAWSLTGEEREFLGYRIQKATAVQDSTAIEAWFTTEIPVSAGPGPYGGLPGMILIVSVDGGKTQYTATEVTLDPPADGVIKAPEDGEEVSHEEYEEIVAEKMEELRAQRRRRQGSAQYAVTHWQGAPRGAQAAGRWWGLIAIGITNGLGSSAPVIRHTSP